MRKSHTEMTARVVPLTSKEASDVRVGGTVAERIALVAELSRALWERTGRPLPSYDRATLPILITTLAGQAIRD